MQPDNKLASYIDHTLLKPTAMQADFARLCEEARECGFSSVCVPPSQIDYCKSFLLGSKVMVCTVIGFPLGYATTETKAAETRNAVRLGADEIDMVMNGLWAQSQQWELVEQDIADIVKTAQGRIVKVIIETAYLSEKQKKVACETIVKAGAHFVKTSTGFAPEGATLKDVKNLKQWVGDAALVKASGGIQTAEQAREMIEAGAARLGTSRGVQLIQPS